MPIFSFDNMYFNLNQIICEKKNGNAEKLAIFYKF